MKYLIIIFLLSGCTSLWPIDGEHFYAPKEVVQALCPPEHWWDPIDPCYIPATEYAGSSVMCVEGQPRWCQEAACKIRKMEAGEKDVSSCVLPRGSLDQTWATRDCHTPDCFFNAMERIR